MFEFSTPFYYKSTPHLYNMEWSKPNKDVLYPENKFFKNYLNLEQGQGILIGSKYKLCFPFFVFLGKDNLSDLFKYIINQNIK